jgi:hypothetical protein
MSDTEKVVVGCYLKLDKQPRQNGKTLPCARLMDENAKLRDLVRYMHRCYVQGHDWGPYGAPEKEWVEEQMRELGIEVDE